jgi:hypothetical protein
LSPSEATNHATRAEWRALGFYYEIVDEPTCWRLVGSAAGLGCVVEVLDRYLGDSRNRGASEHEHYGPYMYLKVETAASPTIDERGIRGSFADLARLRGIVAAALATSRPGPAFVIGPEYSPGVSHPLRFEMREDSFDPASADPHLADTPAK